MVDFWLGVFVFMLIWLWFEFNVFVGVSLCFMFCVLIGICWFDCWLLFTCLILF